MNKNEYLLSLRSLLSGLPPEERNELMEDYETHFTFALQNGKTEQEVILELGSPAELAKEALGNRYVSEEPVYWYGPGSPNSNHGPNPTLNSVNSNVRRRGGFVTSMVYTGLFFVDILVVPLLLSLWSIWFSLVAMAFGGIISPAALLMEYIWNDQFNPAKAFAVLAMMGIGILFAIISKYTFKIFKDLTLGFRTWHTVTARGGKRYE